MTARPERWRDADAGPLVRPYAFTRGRTHPREHLDLVTILTATAQLYPEPGRLSHQQQQILALCRPSHTLADLASELDLPFGVVAVLAADLIELGLLGVVRQAPAQRPDLEMLRKIRDELRAL